MSLGPALMWRMGGDTKGFNKAIDGAKGKTGLFKGALMSLGPVLAGLGLAGVAKSAINLGSKISDVSTQLRIGAQEFQVFAFMARKAGVSTSIIERALRNANNRTQEAINGNKRYAEAFERLGINVAEFVKLPLEQRMEAIAKAQANASDAGQAYNDVAIILGERAGPAMQEILQDLANDGFSNLATSAKDAGEVMDSHTIKKMDDLADKVESAKTKLLVFAAGVIGKVEPAFRMLGQGLGFVGEVFGVSLFNAKAFFEMLVAQISTTLNPALLAFKALGKGIEATMQSMRGNFEEAGESLKSSLDLGKQSMTALMDAPGEMADNFRAMTEDVKSGVGFLGDRIEERSEEIGSAWSDMWGGAAEDAEDAADKSVKSVGKVSAKVKESADVVDAAADKMDKSLDKVGESGTRAVEAVGATVKNVSEAVADAAKAAADAAKALAEEVANAQRQSEMALARSVRDGGDDYEGLSTEKLEYLLADKQDELRTVQRDSFGSASPTKIGTKFIEANLDSLITRLETELDTRSDFARLSGIGMESVAFDPFEAERLRRVMSEPTESTLQTDQLVSIRQELELINNRYPLY